MKDISSKVTTLRSAKANAILSCSKESIEKIKNGSVPKGDPLSVAKVAAIQSAKNCSNIIPFCHPLLIDFAECKFILHEDSIQITTEVKAIYKTGVEMEALTMATVAALTIYDMLKMIDDKLKIISVELVDKKGGKSDFKDERDKKLDAAVLVINDLIFAGKKQDKAGKLILEKLESLKIKIKHYKILPDHCVKIHNEVKKLCDISKVDLVVTTGGTGFTKKDTTPEALTNLIDKRIPGIEEAMRVYGQERTPYAMFSRSIAGLRGNTLILTLPGSTSGTGESLEMLLPNVLHAFKMIYGGKQKNKNANKNK